MTSTTLKQTSIAPQLPLYCNEVRFEFLRLLRARTFSLATIGFPVMFYLLFGVANSGIGAGGAAYSRYLLATYSVFGLVGASLFGIAVTLAQERSLGWLEIKLASPMPAAAYLLAKLLTAMAFGLVIFGILLALGTAFGHVAVTAPQVFKLMLTVALGVLPFATMGLLLAVVIPPNAATGVINLVYLPMSFCSGLWIPLKNLPQWLQDAAPIWPTYHLSQMALASMGFPMKGTPATHILWLLAFSLVMAIAAALLFRRSASHG